MDGEIVAAAQEERFTREKNDADFPARAIEFCLRRAGISVADLDYVAFYDKPLTKFERLLETYVAYAPRGFTSFRTAMPVWLKRKLHLPAAIRKALGRRDVPIVFASHHESHAASAFFPSPFDEAAVLTLDGVGEWSTATAGVGRGNRLELTRELRFPHSLGLLYSAFTYHCGFKVNEGEYKLMGLAPYGRPRYADLIRERLVDVRDDGSLWMDMSYFGYCDGLRMTNERFDRLVGGPPRAPGARIEERHRDLAASVQAVTEEVVFKAASHLHRETGLPHLVLAGGVALNCVANGKLLREGPFREVWIQPAAGDAGGALGAALLTWHQLMNRPRAPGGRDAQKGSFLGPSHERDEIERTLAAEGAVATRYDDESALVATVAEELDRGRVVGWFQGRAEFGPRALGARSILGDPRSPEMQVTLNLKIKFREGFRPFAPVVLRERVHEWFEMRPGEDSPYMLLVAPVREERRVAGGEGAGDDDLTRRVRAVRSTIPAVTHVDHSARVQTVDERHGRFRRLLEAFHARTGCPVLVNTSFNLGWEPIVNSPLEAWRTFMQSEMDVLVLEDFVLRKTEQRRGIRVFADAGAAAPPDDSPWADPATGDPLVVTPDVARNPRTGATYPVEDGIPRLAILPEAGSDRAAVTEAVKAFYEETPFPNYDDLDDARALLEKSRRSRFAALLNEQIPYGARVVEVGCGTGQLTNFLAIAHRTVLGVDLCLNSLRLAEGFRRRQGLERAQFAQTNLFHPALRDAFFDVVISNGVLHHTHDTKAAFLRVARLVRPGGHFVVGLYARYSRSLHAARRVVVRLTGATPRWLDPHFGRVGAASEGKRTAWFRDQYLHPHERSHSLGEVLGWLDEAGLEFVNSIPKPRPGPSLGAHENLFEPRDPGTPWSRAASQIADLRSGWSEGGFFVVVARKRTPGGRA